MDDRERIGRERHARVHGETGTERLRKLEDFAPDFARQVFADGYGNAYDETHFDLRTRTLLTVAMLAAIGNAPAQLESHLRAALRAGWTKDELLAVMSQVAVYAGFPAATNGVLALKRVLPETDQPA